MTDVENALQQYALRNSVSQTTRKDFISGYNAGVIAALSEPTEAMNDAACEKYREFYGRVIDGRRMLVILKAAQAEAIASIGRERKE